MRFQYAIHEVWRLPLRCVLATLHSWLSVEGKSVQSWDVFLRDILDNLQSAVETINKWAEDPSAFTPWQLASDTCQLPDIAIHAERVKSVAGWVLCMEQLRHAKPDHCHGSFERMQLALTQSLAEGELSPQHVLFQGLVIAMPYLKLMSFLSHRDLRSKTQVEFLALDALCKDLSQPSTTSGLFHVSHRTMAAGFREIFSKMYNYLQVTYQNHDLSSCHDLVGEALADWGSYIFSNPSRNSRECKMPPLHALPYFLNTSSNHLRGWCIFDDVLLLEATKEATNLDVPACSQECSLPTILQGRREKIVFEMLSAVVSVLVAHNVLHFLDYGSALGSRRLHGVLPGDHDADIGILAQDRSRVEHILRIELPEWLEICLLPLEKTNSSKARLQQLVVKRRQHTSSSHRVSSSISTGDCSGKPNIDIYTYAMQIKHPMEVHRTLADKKFEADVVLERMDLADKRGPHYGAVAHSLILPLDCACFGGSSFAAPRLLEDYLHTRYGCIGVVGIDCEMDPTFNARGIFYRSIEHFELPTLQMMRERLTQKL